MLLHIFVFTIVETQQFTFNSWTAIHASSIFLHWCYNLQTLKFIYAWTVFSWPIYLLTQNVFNFQLYQLFLQNFSDSFKTKLINIPMFLGSHICLDRAVTGTTYQIYYWVATFGERLSCRYFRHDCLSIWKYRNNPFISSIFFRIYCVNRKTELIVFHIF